MSKPDAGSSRREPIRATACALTRRTRRCRPGRARRSGSHLFPAPDGRQTASDHQKDVSKQLTRNNQLPHVRDVAEYLVTPCAISSREFVTHGNLITGISGAGKTTLAKSLIRILKPRLPELVLVDGDTIRDLFGTGLGFSEPERMVQIRRLQSLAKMLDEQGIVCVVAAPYAHPDLLAWNRENFRDYLEVYIEAPLSLVQQRDAKGLYAAARTGKMANMVGIDIPWHAPAGGRRGDRRRDRRTSRTSGSARRAGTSPAGSCHSSRGCP